MRNALPCVGLVVLVGSLSFVMAPDEEHGPSTAPVPEGSPGLPVVVIDAGHGGRDEGAKGNGLVEKTLTLDLAKRVQRQLATFGFPTVMTRSEDTFVSLPQRAAEANRYNDVLFISIHFNHSTFRGVSGVETFYESDKVPPEAAWTWIGFFNKPDTSRCVSGETLAGYLQTSLVTYTAASNRGIKARDLYVVRHVRGAAVLIEGGFLSNKLDARLLSNPAYLNRLADAVVEGVMTYAQERTQPNPPSVGPLVKLER